MTIWEASGVGNYDTGLISGANNAGATGADGDATPNITTAEANELILASIVNLSGSFSSLAPGTGFVEDYENAASALVASEHKTAGAAGTYNATWTAGDTDAWGYMIAAFKEAAAGVSLTPTIGSLSASGVASRNDRGIPTPTEVNIA
jgi:hypothetical protein